MSYFVLPVPNSFINAHKNPGNEQRRGTRKAPDKQADSKSVRKVVRETIAKRRKQKPAGETEEIETRAECTERDECIRRGAEEELDETCEA